MNKVRELRIEKGIQQKDLAISIGVSQAAISDWEKNKKNPKGENLRKISEFFGVSEDEILYGGQEKKPITVVSPEIAGKSQTDQIVEQLLVKLSDPSLRINGVAQTSEARILARGVDKLPKAQREQALNVVKAMFAEYADYFERGSEDDGT